MNWHTMILAEAQPSGPQRPDVQVDVGSKQTVSGTGDPGPVPKAPAKPGLFGGWELPLILLGVLVFFFLMTNSQKKNQKKQQQMLSSLKKNDKVQTSGGVIGIVVEVREQEVILKVDESSNTRMRFVRGAIARVLNADADKAEQSS